MNTLKDLIGAPSAAKADADPFLSAFGLARNPFPPARTIIPQIIFDQQQAVTTFAAKVKDLLQSEPQRRSMAIVGGTGGGKTHFLRYCQNLVIEYQRELTKPLVVVEVLAGAGSVTHILREIVRQCDESSKAKGEYDLLTAVVRNASTAAHLESVRQVDLKSVLNLLYRSTQPNFIPPDRDKRHRFETLRDLAKRWLAGATLTSTERNYLGVFSRLATAAMVTRVLSELLALARKMDIIEGVFLCIDEIETLFTGGASTGKVQGFLQDTRYLFDEAIRNSDGYSLLILSAATQNGAANLRNYNYPVYQRLGFEGESRVELKPIENIAEAKSFAKLYLDYGREIAKISGISSSKTYGILTDVELTEAYRSAASPERGQARLIERVNQAQLLEALHAIIETKRAAKHK